MRPLRHYPVWFGAIWSEGKCESVWSRNVSKGELTWRRVHPVENRKAPEHRGKRYWEGVSSPGRDWGKEFDRKLETGGLEVEFGILMSTFSLTLWALSRSHTLMLALTGFLEQEKELNRRTKIRQPLLILRRWELQRSLCWIDLRTEHFSHRELVLR